MYESDFTPVWEDGASATDSGQVTDLTDSDSTSGETAPQTNGPLAATVEKSGWTQQDIEIALQLANLVVLGLALYTAYEGDS